KDIAVPPLFFNATVAKIGTDENRAFATQFAVPGNATITIICEFQTKSDFGFSERNYPLSLDAKLNERDWETIKRFTLNVSQNDALVLVQGKLRVSDNHK
ncbi:MAG: hypothetical protein PVG75_10810, partial [Thioalkalispiraceae bacterium]